MAKVYAKIENDIVKEINSDIFLHDIDGYTLIDEGDGDKYAHAQGCYLKKGLMDNNCKYNYKYVDGELVELTDDEKATLFPDPQPQATNQEILNAQLIQQNAETQVALQEQKQLNSQILLEIANLKSSPTTTE